MSKEQKASILTWSSCPELCPSPGGQPVLYGQQICLSGFMLHHCLIAHGTWHMSLCVLPSRLPLPLTDGWHCITLCHTCTTVYLPTSPQGTLGHSYSLASPSLREHPWMHPLCIQLKIVWKQDCWVAGLAHVSYPRRDMAFLFISHSVTHPLLSAWWV